MIFGVPKEPNYSLLKALKKTLGYILLRLLKEEFPEITLNSIRPSDGNPENTKVNICFPPDEDKEVQIRESAAKISTQILEKYGYNVTISCEN